jgi:hypothetical protein
VLGVQVAEFISVRIRILKQQVGIMTSRHGLTTEANDPLWLWFLITCIGLLGLLSGLARADEASASIAVIDAQLTARRNARPELPNDFNTQPDRQTEERGAAPSMRVEAAGSLLGTLQEALGSSGKIVFQPDGPIVISRPEATVTIRPGTEITYSLSERGGVLTFGSPKPRIEAKVLGLRVSPDLTRLELAADNSGIATVESGPLKLSKRFKLAWEDGQQFAQATGSRCVCGCGKENCTCSAKCNSPPVNVAAKSLPKVTLHAPSWCGACADAKAALLVDGVSRTDLPFEVELDQREYSGMSYPQLRWTSKSGQLLYAGWSSLDGLTAMLRANQ